MNSQQTVADQPRFGYRRALDYWRATGAEGPMPQPQDHGVRLPDLEPVQVHWAVP